MGAAVGADRLDLSAVYTRRVERKLEKVLLKSPFGVRCRIEAANWKAEVWEKCGGCALRSLSS